VNGPIPDGAWVLHRCDNPPCCNPAHLFLGDAAANVADMVAKGRHRPRGRRPMRVGESARRKAAAERRRALTPEELHAELSAAATRRDRARWSL
jgi:hypothetical protein